MKNNQTVKSEREAALDILLNVLEEGCFSGSAIDKELKRQSRKPESRAFITRLSEGTIERLITIDDALDSCASMPCRKMKPVIRNILRESVYQIFFMDNVADAVAVNEAVSLAKKRGFAGLSKFVNGVLRTVGRRKDSFSFYTEEENRQEKAEKPAAGECTENSVYYSVPVWLVRHMENAVGRDRAEAVFRDFLTVHPLQARINRTNADKRKVVESLVSDRVHAAAHPYLDNVICLEGASHLTRTKAFREGWIQIQDASSVLAVTAAGIRPGMRVLDVCAAPGGKSLCAADYLGGAENCSAGADDRGRDRRESTENSGVENRGEKAQNSGAENCSAGADDRGKDGEKAAALRKADNAADVLTPGKMPGQRCLVRSRDLTDLKVEKIRENARRCHFEDRIVAETADARIFDPALEGWADVVIADLPCSGLGVIAKKPDIKYRVQPEDLTGLAALQREILSVVWRYVKPGGVLIYSTCTVSPEENGENVRWFLSQGYPMEADDMAPFLPELLTAELLTGEAGKQQKKDEKSAGAGGELPTGKAEERQKKDEKSAGAGGELPTGKAEERLTKDEKSVGAAGGHGTEKPEEARRTENAQKEKITQLQLLPGEYETDGFFIARFRRIPKQEHQVSFFD